MFIVKITLKDVLPSMIKLFKENASDFPHIPKRQAIILFFLILSFIFILLYKRFISLPIALMFMLIFYVRIEHENFMRTFTVPRVKDFRLAGLILAAGMVTSIIPSLILHIAGYTGSPQNLDQLEKISVYSYPTVILFMTPELIVEELIIFAMILMSYSFMKPTSKNLFVSLIISCFFFACMHLGWNWQTAVIIFFAHFPSLICLVLTKNLKPCIIAHLLNDFIVLTVLIDGIPYVSAFIKGAIASWAVVLTLYQIQNKLEMIRSA